jgi:LAO/AO transport system kinase
MCDVFVLLLAPAGGDELQGVKRGIMEMADIILVNKADGDLKPAASRTVADYSGALRLLRKRPQDPEGFPRALPVSAVTGEGLAGAWEDMQALARWRKDEGWWERRRAEQAAHWFEEEVRAGLLARLRSDPKVRAAMAERAEAVAAGEVTPAAAAEEMLGWLKG